MLAEYDSLQSSLTGNGQWCQRLDSVSCYNSRAVLSANNAEAVNIAQQLPAAPVPAPAPSLQGLQITAQLGIATAPVSTTATGGRRLLAAA